MTDPAAATCWPLSAAQRGIWLGHQVDRSRSAFNIAEYYDVTGRVDAAALARACSLTVAETQALRTVFGPGDETGAVVQTVTGHAPAELLRVDCRDAADPARAAQEWMAADLSQPVELAGGRLWTMALLQLSADRFFWYQRCHHIVLDHTGFRLVRRRIAEHYADLLSGAPTTRPAVPPLAVLLDADAEYQASAEF